MQMFLCVAMVDILVWIKPMHLEYGISGPISNGALVEYKMGQG